MSQKDNEVPIWNSVTTTDLTVNTAVGDAEKPPTPEGPTDSHVLSQVEQVEKGLIQKAGETADITDVGWTNLADHTEQLIAGLQNEDLWMLIRRFDNVFMLNESITTAFTPARCSILSMPLKPGIWSGVMTNFDV